MKFLNKMQRKFGKYAIPNLSLVLILGYVVGYIFELLGILQYFTLNPALVFQGQVWRLFTWVITPPGSLDIFTIIMLFFYYSIGTNLERTWGTFRYNVYIFSGILFTAIGVLGLYGVLALFGIPSIGGYVSTYYLCMSIFLAFAMEYPDMQVYLYMIIPIKIKWLAYLDAAFLILMFIMGGWVTRVLIVTCLLNFIVLFFATRDYSKVSPKEIKRKQDYKKKIKMSSNANMHKCAICGQTSESNPELSFRYCSKCNGNYEYCEKHIFTHEHIQ